MAPHIIILGAGIAGLTSALALRKQMPSPKPKITVVEIRSAPSTIGGAVNLTPLALRYLDCLGVYETMLANEVGAECKTIELFDLYSGKFYAEVDFRGSEGQGIGAKGGKKYFARRVMRWQIQEALLTVVRQQEDTEVVFGKKATELKESDEEVQLTFEDGDTMSGDMLLGCDGIHSATRSLLIDPERNPTYTGIAVVMAVTNLRAEMQLKWTATGLVSSRRGSLMCSYFEKTRKQQYIAAVMEIAEVASREGWKARGSNIKEDILGRFRSDNMLELEPMVDDADDWTLYPVYKLPPGGKWASAGGRCILLGDSAHAMPPQGESTGICIEDAIVFSRAMIHFGEKSPQAICNGYEKFRRPHTDAAYQSASQRWESVKDKGWLAHQILMFLTPWFLWWTAKARDEEFAKDLSSLEVQVLD